MIYLPAPSTVGADIDSDQTPSAQIVRLYLVALGRRPDKDGLEAYVSHLRNGQTLEQIAAAFTTSDEFLASAGRQPASLVLYRNAHGVMPAPGWPAAHQAPEILAASLVRDPMVARRLPVSPGLGREADPWLLAAEIVRLYLLILGRRPDPVGLASYVELRRTGLALEDVAAAFLASDEFRGQAGDEAAAVVLHRHAHGAVPPAGWTSSNTRPPEVVATALVTDPAVMRRLSVLGALYPDGVPLDDAILYRRWLAELARPDAGECEAIRQDRSVPTVSWIMVLDDPRPEWLDAAITSVRAQHAPGIELLLVSGRRCATAIRHAREDVRVHAIRGLPWSPQAKLFGRALAACRGEFVGVLGQHDLLHETATYEVARAAASADVVIGDEDAVDAAGLRHSPRFGANRHPDAWLPGPCSGTVVMRTSLARKAGGLGPGRQGSGWDQGPRGSGDEPGSAQFGALISRVMTDVGPERLQHVPALLRSRRDPPALAQPRGERPAKRHRVASAREISPDGSQGAAPGVVFPVPAVAMVSIIVPTRDRAPLLRTCLQGLLERTSYPALEVLVLDNGSREAEALALLDWLGLDPRVRVLRCGGPFNWSALNNRGVREMRGEVAVLLNNDIEVTSAGWLRAMVSQALRPDVGLVGAKLLYPDLSVQHAGMVLGPAGRATHMWRHSDGSAAGYMDQLVTARDVTALTGACIAVRRAVYERVDGLEESLPVTWSDVDLCLRVRAAGLRVIWTPHAVLTHHEQASRGTDETDQGQARLAREREWMLRRWGEAMDVDPFLSPNMLPSETQALLAPVPRRVPPWQRP